MIQDDRGLKISSATKLYSDRTAVRELSLSVRPGERVALVGANGSGKSTLLRCLSGLETLDSGEVFFWGLSPHRASSFRRLKAELGIGLLSEKNQLYRSLTIRENLTLAVRLSGGKASREDARRMVQMLEIEGELDSCVSHCSMGIARRAGLARLLLLSPGVLLLDEPFSNLDTRGRDLLCSCLGAIDCSNRLLIVATHVEESLGGLATRQIVLEQGSVKEDVVIAEGK